MALSGPAGAVAPQIAASGAHTLAIKSDGTLWAWGKNEEGQLGDGTSGRGVHKDIPTRIGTDSDWTALAAGVGHSLALKSDGSLWAWGSNSRGQLGDGTRGQGNKKAIPTRIGNDIDWTTIDAGGGHSLALKSDGSLWAWGSNYRGQLGDGTETGKPVPIQIGADTDWKAISAGMGHSLALKADGSMWSWGENDVGQLGDGTSGFELHRSIPIQVGGDTDWLAIAAGKDYSFALKTDGSLWSWGGNLYGQGKTVPTRIGTDSDWVAIAAGEEHTLALKADGTLWAWGDNSQGQLGDGTSGWGKDKSIPTRVGTATDWIAVAAGDEHSAALKFDGTLWTWGNNKEGQRGDGTREQTIPSQVGADADWAMVTAGDYLTLALKTDGSLWVWGRSNYGRIVGKPNTGKAFPIRVGTDADWAMVNAEGSSTFALKSDGTLWGWGNNSHGRLGLGLGTQRETDRTVPTRIGAATNWAAITNGSEHTLALKADGSLWAWGMNGLGQLGDGTNLKRKINLFEILLALTHGGSVAWKGMKGGQLDGGTRYRAVPTRIGTGTGWKTITAGGSHNLALKTDGCLWVWGSNSWGQLGDGTSGIKASKSAPIKIGADTDWIAIAAGDEHSAALKSDGTLWTWGNNQFGQLGNGTSGNEIHKTFPTRIGTDTDWKTITSGAFHNLILKTDGSLWAWGWNNYGQLGDGTTTNKTVPIQIGSGTDWVAVAAGRCHSLGLKSDGTLWAWGGGNFGQRGDGRAAIATVPVQTLINLGLP